MSVPLESFDVPPDLVIVDLTNGRMTPEAHRFFSKISAALTKLREAGDEATYAEFRAVIQEIV